MRPLAEIACLLTALGPAAAQSTPAVATELLTVRAQPGYTHYLFGMQVRSYPLLIVATDGTITASTHPGAHSGAEFRIFSGKLAADDLTLLRKRLLDMLPPVESHDGPVVVDAPSVEITVTVDDRTERRTTARLGLTLDELLRLHELTAEERAVADQRLAFARMVDALRHRATNPYRPSAVDILVENADHEKSARIQPWPIPELDLAKIARACHPDPDRGGDSVPVTDKAAMLTLAAKVVSGRRYRSGDRVYSVFWFPATR